MSKKQRKKAKKANRSPQRIRPGFVSRGPNEKKRADERAQANLVVLAGHIKERWGQAPAMAKPGYGRGPRLGTVYRGRAIRITWDGDERKFLAAYVLPPKDGEKRAKDVAKITAPTVQGIIAGVESAIDEMLDKSDQITLGEVL